MSNIVNIEIVARKKKNTDSETCVEISDAYGTEIIKLSILYPEYTGVTDISKIDVLDLDLFEKIINFMTEEDFCDIFSWQIDEKRNIFINGNCYEYDEIEGIIDNCKHCQIEE